MKYFTLIFCCIFVVLNTAAQINKDTNHVFTLPAEDVLNAKPLKREETVSVASFQTTSLRNSPSAITLISEEEIKKSGARDITEVLRLVAGLDFAQNFDMVMGLAVRGNWADEGKFLFMLDGQTLNDTAFGTLMYYIRVPIADIERVEIMRGAGSALYGGLASLCVIHIITKHKTAGNSITLNSQIGVARKGISRTSLQAYLHQQLKTDMSFSISANMTQANMSNLLVQSPLGTNIDYSDSSRVEADNIRLGFRNKAWRATILWNRYKFTAQPELITPNPKEVAGTMHDFIAGIATTFVLSDKWMLEPRLQWKAQRPWWYQNYQNVAGRATYDRYKTLNYRATAGLLARYKPQKWWDISLGSEFFWDYAQYFLKRYTFYNGKNDIDFTNIAFFAESMVNTKVVNLTLSLRADKNSAYQWAFAPRVALTKSWKNLHAKAMLNYAFKAPTIQNIQYGFNKNIRPEWVRTVEFEAGYTWQEKLFLTANLYDINIDGPILYVFNPATLEDSYENKARTGTRGIEFEAKWKSEKWFCKINHAFYQNQHSEVTDYLVEGRQGLLAGLPTHKTALNAYTRLHKNWHIGIMGVFFNEKFTYSYFGQNFTDFRLNRFPPTYSLSLTTHYKMPWRGWEASLGVYNITNQQMWLVSPTASGVPPFPEQGREVVLRLAYQIER